MKGKKGKWKPQYIVEAKIKVEQPQIKADGLNWLHLGHFRI